MNDEQEYWHATLRQESSGDWIFEADDKPVVVTRKALAEHVGKTVPATYKGRPVGSATLREDGRLEVVFADDESAELVADAIDREIAEPIGFLSQGDDDQGVG